MCACERGKRSDTCLPGGCCMGVGVSKWWVFVVGVLVLWRMWLSSVRGDKWMD